MSTPPRMMPHATRHAGDSDDVATPMGPMTPYSSPRASERKRLNEVVEAAEPTAVDLVESLFLTTHALKHMGQQCMGQADPRLHAISFPRARLLMAMAEAGQRRVRMGDLSAALGVTARNVTTIVDGLEREGMLARRSDPTDRRAILIELTPKGEEHVAQVHAIQCEIAESFFMSLDAGDRRELMRLLATIREGLAARGDATPEAAPPAEEC